MTGSAVAKPRRSRKGAKVVALNGGPIASARRPNPELVEALEDVLNRAKAGEINSAVVAYVYADGSTSYQLVSSANGQQNYSLIGAMACAQAVLVRV